MLKFTAGLRYSKLDYTGVTRLIECCLFGTVNVSSTSSRSDKPFTPRFVLSYQPDRDSLYYVSAAKGFRPGGVNEGAPAICGVGQPPLTFAPDSLWQYEIGSKRTLFDQRVQIVASAYYIQWKNIQQLIYLACGSGFDYNLGEVAGKGGNVAIAWRATSNLTLGLTGAYTDSVYTSNVALATPTGNIRLVTTGDHLPASPWNVGANAEYVWEATAKKPYVRLDYQFTTAQRSLVPYQDPANVPNDDSTLPGLPEIRILSLRAGLRFDGFDVSLFVKNALDYHTPIVVSRDSPTTLLNGFPSNFDTNYFGRGYAPRSFGATMTYRF
jgi:iron complex outermembrane recepter protein